MIRHLIIGAFALGAASSASADPDERDWRNELAPDSTQPHSQQWQNAGRTWGGFGSEFRGIGRGVGQDARQLGRDFKQVFRTKPTLKNDPYVQTQPLEAQPGYAPIYTEPSYQPTYVQPAYDPVYSQPVYESAYPAPVTIEPSYQPTYELQIGPQSAITSPSVYEDATPTYYEYGSYDSEVIYTN